MFCCNTVEINQSNFEAGHIISEFNGGPITVDNILPICGTCNRSMGKTNMDEFISNHLLKACKDLQTVGYYRGNLYSS